VGAAGASARGFAAPRLLRAMGQGMATTQFYVYGRWHFTQTGWEKHSAAYPTPDPLDSADLSGRVYAVTGANAGIGREIATFLAKKGGKVFLVCRDQGRAETARQEILAEVGAEPGQLVVVQGDVGLQRDVRRVAAQLTAEAPAGLDGLVCNAGALLNERTLTEEGVEVTFATHFLFGSYLLTELLRPALRAAAERGREPRTILVSSGGMYNVAFPAWSVAASQPEEEGGEPPGYDGQLAYAYAKRGQVLLAERWAEQEEGQGGADTGRITFVTAHPGWTGTKAVQEAYGDTAKWLEPMRTTWQGAEGICWLCAAPAAELQPGAFYLDREPQVKHLAGPFMTEGWFTQNSREDVDTLLAESTREAPVVA